MPFSYRQGSVLTAVAVALVVTDTLDAAPSTPPSNRIDLIYDTLKEGVPKYELPTAQGSAQLNKRSITTATATSTAHGFVIDFYCNIPELPPQVEIKQCSKALESFRIAADHLADEIVLQEVLHVNATYGSFCSVGYTRSDEELADTTSEMTQEQVYSMLRAKSTNRGCSYSTLGHAAPANFYTFDNVEAIKFNVDPLYNYPAPLYRQIVAGSTLEESMPTYDITMDFNAMGRWYMVPDAIPINSRQYDLAQVAMHELTHGLGFLTSWLPWVITDRRLLNILLPGFPLYDSNGELYTLSKPYIFNKFISDNVNSQWLHDYHIRIYDSIQAAPYGSVSDLIAEGEIKNMLDAVTKASTSVNGLLYWMLDSSGTQDYEVLYTPSKWSSGSSISHVENELYKGTSEFLLRPYATSGVTLQNYAPISTSGYLSRVKRIMKTMGYQVYT